MTLALAALAGAIAILLALVLGRDPFRGSVRSRWMAAGFFLLASLGFAPAASAGVDMVSRSAALEGSAQWRHIRAVWAEAEEIASGKRGSYPFDLQGMKRVIEEIEKARAEVLLLPRQKLLSEPEAALLEKDLARLAQGVEAKRPTEAMDATCYKPMVLSPARSSLERLRERLPLLERLAASDALQPRVVRKLLASARADLDALKSSQETLETAGERAKAVKTMRSAEEALRRIDSRLPPDQGP